jgi:hypothetical protein
MSLESRDARHGPHYASVHDRFLTGLSRTRAGADLRRTLRRQEALVGALSAAAQVHRQKKGTPHPPHHHPAYAQPLPSRSSSPTYPEKRPLPTLTFPTSPLN